VQKTAMDYWWKEEKRKKRVRKEEKRKYKYRILLSNSTMHICRWVFNLEKMHVLGMYTVQYSSSWNETCLRRKRRSGLLVFCYKQVLLWCLKRQSFESRVLQFAYLSQGLLYFPRTIWRSRNALCLCIRWMIHMQNVCRDWQKEKATLLTRSSQNKYFC
jgi:hypothetical protein